MTLPKTTEQFERYYSLLNPEQKLAVDSIEGPVIVIAGPGTGKTQILTLRIANILRQVDIEPDNILALTFTESGVASMRKRLAEIIGTPAYYVTITTFHSFCNDIIKRYPEEFPRIIGATSITEIDQIKLLEEIISQTYLQFIKPFGDIFYYLRPVLSSINELKRQGLTPEQFTQIVEAEAEAFKSIDDLYNDKGPYKGKMKSKYQTREKQINKNRELALVYTEYQKSLTEHKSYDYSDMIMEVVQRLRTHEDLLLMLQEQYQYILVDEHQDTNNAQNALLELLTNFHPDPNVFVVGDEKQAIYRFQGASLENFLYLKQLYPSAKLINLRSNYRSSQTILDAAHDVLASTPALQAQAGHAERPIKLAALSQPDVESYYITTSIRDLIGQGTHAENIAVLYRDNRDALALAQMLQKFSLPYTIKSDLDLLNDTVIKKIVLILRAVHELGVPARLFEVMHLDVFDILPLDIYKLADHARAQHLNPYDIIASADVLATIGAQSTPALIQLSTHLTHWQTLAHNDGLLELFADIIRETFLKYSLSQPDYFETIDKINGLFHYIRSFVQENKEYSLADFIGHLDLLKEHAILIKHTPGINAKGIQLMTTHRSKGLEFDHVYIINAHDGHWGNRRKYQLIKLPESVGHLTAPVTTNEAEDKDDDERNLFYVALTRARKQVTISYAQTNLGGKEQLPAQFVQEIKPDYLEAISTTAIEQDYENHRDILFTRPAAHADQASPRDFVRALFLKHGLSVTGLNNYLACPWRYFYDNLLQIPKAPGKSQLYGIAVHAALKDLFDQPGLDPVVAQALLLERFTVALAKQPLTSQDYADCLRQGTTSLTGYYQKYQQSWPRNVLTEFSIKGIQLTPEIMLRGNLDKIELLDSTDPDSATSYRGKVNVVDYKTGRPKTRGVLEGTTQASNGDYKRQLTFYNLLLNQYQEGRFKMISGELDFIEPDDKGNYHKELFTITPEEITELTELITTTANEILNVSFWDKRCEEKNCPYCSLRELMN